MRPWCEVDYYSKTHGHRKVLLSNDDVDLYLSNKWHLANEVNYPYLQTSRGKTFHREIMINLYGKSSNIVDHINGNTLDNRRENLRFVNKSKNNMNAEKVKKKTSSKYKGVVWRKASSNWKAYIKINKKQIHLGHFETEEEAAIAYNEASKIYFGEYRRENRV